MTPELPGGSNPQEPEETGQPLGVLTELDQETSADFVVRVRRKIERRNATANLVSFSWHLPKLILTEMAGMVAHLGTTAGTRRKSKP